MSDFCDDANDMAEFFLKDALSRRKPTGPEATGFCLNCGVALFTKPQRTALLPRWCDTNCRDTWQRKQKGATDGPLEE